MCTGRVDLAFLFRALAKGADGVIIGGCWPGECHYVTEGNYDALGNMLLGRKLLELIGLRPERIRLEWIAASEGMRFAEVMSDFAGEMRELGPIGQGEGLDADALQLRLQSVNQVLPFLKLVERERLRVPAKSEEAYKDYFASAEVNRLFGELIAEKITVSQILLALGEKPLSTGEISETLGLSSSEVSRYMNSSSRQGLVSFDMTSQCYALA